MTARILVLGSLMDLSTPRRMACRSTMPNQTSTRFIQEAWVGVKCTTNRGCSASHALTCLVLVGGVVVHHQVQLHRDAVGVEDVTVGPPSASSPVTQEQQHCHNGSTLNNHRRGHTALDGHPPISRVNDLPRVTNWNALAVLGRQVHDSRLIGGCPPSAEWRR